MKYTSGGYGEKRQHLPCRKATAGQTGTKLHEHIHPTLILSACFCVTEMELTSGNVFLYHSIASSS